MGELVEGSLAPLFEAESVDGRYVQLERHLGYRHVLLVFLGGSKRANERRLHSLTSCYPSFVENDAEVIAVCACPPPETPPTVAGPNANGRPLPFPLVNDPGFELGETYGQRRSFWTKKPLPAQFLICKRGIVRFVEYARSAWDATPPTWILNLIRKL